MWGELIGAAANIGGGLIGNAMGQGDRDLANQYDEEALNQWLALHGPSYLGTPNSNIQSQAGVAKGSPASDEYENIALREMAARAGGKSARANAEMQSSLNEAGNYERASRDAQMAKLRPNSGAAVAAQMMASQQGANRANLGGLNAAAIQEQYQQDALRNLAGTAGARSGRMFSQDFNRGQAQDAMAQFNDNNRFRNNQAYNQFSQNDYNARLNKAQGTSAAYGNLAAGKRGQAGATGQQWAGIGQGVGNVASNWGGGTQQPQVKQFQPLSQYAPDDEAPWNNTYGTVR